MDSQTRLDQLISGLCDGILSQLETDELNALLRQDGAARRRYLDLLDLHAEFAIMAEAMPAIPRVVRRTTNFRALLCWSAAAAVVLFLGLGLLRPSAASNAPGSTSAQLPIAAAGVQEVARIEAAIAPKWRDELAAADGLAVGQRHRLVQGFVQLDLPNATIVLEAPCEFSLDRNGVELLYGTVLVRVKAGSRDFAVWTPHGRFTDVGTVFGVNTRSQQATCHVFSGAVHVGPVDEPRSPRLPFRATLMAGEAGSFAGGALLPLPGKQQAEPNLFASHLSNTEGVYVLRGQIHLATAVPSQRSDWLTEDILIVPERGLRLPRAISASIANPGVYRRDFSRSADPYTIVAGTDVRSYLVHFGAAVDFESEYRIGAVTFDKPVIGILCSANSIAASEAVWGGIPSEAGAFKDRRGLELEDVVTLSDDRRTVTIGLKAWYVDYLRIITAE